ncbi:Nramp family divalent metal transporter [Algoriphagus sp.]|uniref:Nramp family divalent metal transporter n=1 Tax=Algoriphagus sp. TaxID=1872435 RepID=UPI00391AEA9B
MIIKNPFRNLGPGPLIAAAFIGPGTVTVCTLAGANFGFSLIWALALSIIATVILQEISGRIGILTGSDLSTLLRNQKGNPIFRLFSMVLVLLAIVLGNAAYESGNISGANLGLAFYWEAPTLKFLGLQLQSGNFILGLIAFLLLWTGSYKALERILVALVIFMSIAFSITAILTKPDLSLLLTGFVPKWNTNEIPTLVALIGTTVVPYNLFLYASLVNKRWKKESDLPLMRRDIAVSVILGGIVSMAILIVGAANTSTEITSAIDVSKGLETVFGSFAGYMMGFGLLAAGLTSSLTAPLAAGFVVCGIMGWDQEIKSRSMRISMGIIVGLGLLFSSFGIKPVQLITLAQLANGILLPIISGWIIWIASQNSVLGKHKNTPIATGIAGFIWLITLVLGLKSVGTVFGWF